MARDDSGMVPRQAAGGAAAAASAPPMPASGIALRLLRATLWLVGILAAMMATAVALELLARADPEGRLADMARTRATSPLLFSVAKIVLTALVGLALEEGRLENLDLPITDFLPELGSRDAGFHAITLAHLMR